MLEHTSLASFALLALSTLIGDSNAAPIRRHKSNRQKPHAEGSDTKLVSNNAAWGPPGGGPPSGGWQPPNWPYVPSWQTTGSPAPTGVPSSADSDWSSPTGAPTQTGLFTSWTETTIASTVTGATTIYSTWTAPTTTVIVSPTPPHTHTPIQNPTTPPTTVPTSVPTSIPTSIPTSVPTSILTSIPTSILTSAPPPPPATSGPVGTPPGTPTIIPTSNPVAPTTSTGPAPTGPVSSNGQLAVTIENNVGSNNIYAYLTGVDSSGALVMLTSDGTFYYPSASSGNPVLITANIDLSLNAGSNQFTIPGYISSARVWFGQGQLQFSAVQTEYGVGLVEPTVTNINDPSENINWGFMELTNNSEDGLFANLSFVDFVGLGIGMELSTPSGTQSAPGMSADGATQVCNALKAQAAQDGQSWGSLCETDSNGNVLRVLSPQSYLNINTGAFNGYFDDYVNQVWSQYSSQPLYIDSQTDLGTISCQVSGGILNCNGDNRGYVQPSSADIFSCSTGTFTIEQTDNDVHRAVVPRLCAAFNRATLLIPGGNVQPKVHPDKYYTTTPNNMYSKIVHSVEADGQGYAFPYDDVAPAVKWGVAGIVASPEPEVLTITLG